MSTTAAARVGAFEEPEAATHQPRPGAVDRHEAQAARGGVGGDARAARAHGDLRRRAGALRSARAAAGDPAGRAQPRPPLRHRRHRPRRPQPHHLRQPHLAVGGAAGGRHRDLLRHDHRPAVRLLRGPPRPHPAAGDGRGPGHPGTRAGAGHRLGAQAEHDQRDARDRGGDHPRQLAHRAGGGALGEAEPLRRGGPGHRLPPAAAHSQPHPAQRDGADPDHRVDLAGQRDPHRGHAVASSASAPSRPRRRGA